MKHWHKTIILFILLTLAAAARFPTPQTTDARQATSLAIENIVNLGVPAGNGSVPKHLALHRQAGLLYILSDGLPALEQGNGLSVYNIKTGQITEHVKINQGNNQTLDLQIDPQAGLLYALWQPQFSDTPPSLSVISSQTLQVVETLPNIRSIAAASRQLFAVGNGQLLAFSASGSGLTERQRVPLSAAAGPMAVSPDDNRLYLAQNDGGTWTLQIFEADTLTPVGSAPFETEILNIIPHPTAGQVLVIAAQNDLRALYRLTAGGELADLPYELGPRYGAAGIALSPAGDALYYSSGQFRSTDPAADTGGPALIGLDASTLSPLVNIPLLTNFDDLAVDSAANRAFALYPFEDLLYEINLETGEVEIVNTAIELKDVVVSGSANQVFVSDSANRIRRLNGSTLAVQAQTRLETNGDDYGFQSATWAGELALDEARNRLYVSGLPATVLNANTLAPVGTLEPGGQLAPDPTGDNIYASNCGLTIVDAPTLRVDRLVPGSGPRADGLSPNPCVGYSRLDAANQLLYSLVPNGTPGSNSGSLLYVYDLTLDPTLIFSDTNISFVRVEPDPTHRRAFLSYVRHSNRRLLTLSVPASGPIQYTQQLFGVWGDIRYSPGSNRLFLVDRSLNRLLTLNADTLAVVDELVLPPNYDYRLAGLDASRDRLFLIGLDGQLLIASAGASQPQYQPAPEPTRSPTGAVLALHPDSAGNVVARIESGSDSTPRLYRSTNQGQSWADLSANLPALPVQAVAASAGGDTLFAGLLTRGQTGRLYRSTNGGQGWQPAMNGLQDLWVENLFIGPNFAETGLIFAQTTYAGLHVSTNGGQRWQPLAELNPNALFPGSAPGFAVAMSDRGQILVSQALDEMRGVFRSQLRPDGSLAAWQQVLDIPLAQLALSPDGATALGYGTSLWRSTNGGESWEIGGAGLSNLGDAQPHRIFFSPKFGQDQTAYIFFTSISGATPGQLFRSTDGGQRWQPWQPPAQPYTAIAPAPNGDFLLGDAQAQLTRIAPTDLDWAVDSPLPAEPFPVEDLAVSPNYPTDQTMFAVSSRHGLYVSTSGGQGWQRVDFLARTFDVSLRGYQLAASPGYGQDQTLFVATGRSLHRSTDGGDTWQQLRLAPTQALTFQAQQVALSPNFEHDRTLLAITNAAVYRSTDGGDTWQQVLTAGGEAGTVDLLAFAPDGQSAYARFGYSHALFTSTNGGQSWQMQPGSPDDQFFSISAAAIAPNGTLTAAVEFENRLLQAGPQTQGWRNFGGSLPAELADVRAVAYGPGGALLVAGQGGIFRTTDSGQSWQPASAGLPPAAGITGLLATDTHLFATLATGQIFTSADNGNSWIDVSVVK